jgi:hypothetical protein
MKRNSFLTAFLLLFVLAGFEPVSAQETYDGNVWINGFQLIERIEPTDLSKHGAIHVYLGYGRDDGACEVGEPQAIGIIKFYPDLLESYIKPWPGMKDCGDKWSEDGFTTNTAYDLYVDAMRLHVKGFDLEHKDPPEPLNWKWFQVDEVLTGLQRIFMEELCEPLYAGGPLPQEPGCLNGGRFYLSLVIHGCRERFCFVAEEDGTG